MQVRKKTFERLNVLVSSTVTIINKWYAITIHKWTY